MQVSWDYTERARTYDKRPDYSTDAISDLLTHVNIHAGIPVADIGAGTAKLTLPLLQHGLVVNAVEPNDAMRGFGIANTQEQTVTWFEGTGENTGLPTASVDAAFFGSSFNVVDPQKALDEVARIVKPGGWFACMWNHRDLADPLQAKVEGIIQSQVEDYNYGTRRKDPTETIDASGLFNKVSYIEGNFETLVNAQDWVEAWRSHATLSRQAHDRFESIISQVNDLVKDRIDLRIPYTTRIWYAQLKVK
jgi:ubiquinone/menaquinone biosynthesis C-methylase UbiE